MVKGGLSHESREINEVFHDSRKFFEGFHVSRKISEGRNDYRAVGTICNVRRSLLYPTGVWRHCKPPSGSRGAPC